MALCSWLLCCSRMPPWSEHLSAVFLAWWSFFSLAAVACSEETMQDPDFLSAGRRKLQCFHVLEQGTHVFPSCLCCLVSWSLIHFWLPPWIKGENWHHNTSMFHHILVVSIYFLCVSELNREDVLLMINFSLVSTVHAWTSPDLSAQRNGAVPLSRHFPTQCCRKWI